jgi:GntR family transcriptional regulator
MEIETDPPRPTEFQPLYAQVKALMTRRIAAGDWKPGMMIPNEFQLAAEYNVSQGTVRKALIALEAARLIVRRQGRGTYVAEHTRELALFHFFRIVGLNDQRLEPCSRVISQKTVNATREVARLLEIEKATPVHVVNRIRTLNAKPSITERIFTPTALMPDLAIKLGAEMVDEMYVIYQKQYGITIAHASERLAAVAANADDARLLDIEAGTPLLEITRVARDVSNTAVELRISRCHTDHLRYAAEVK